MTATTSQAQLSPAAGLNAADLAVAAAGIMVQYFAGEDFPTIPPGPIILLAAAAVVVFGPGAGPLWSGSLLRPSFRSEA